MFRAVFDRSSWSADPCVRQGASRPQLVSETNLRSKAVWLLHCCPRSSSKTHQSDANLLIIVATVTHMFSPYAENYASQSSADRCRTSSTRAVLQSIVPSITAWKAMPSSFSSDVVFANVDRHHRRRIAFLGGHRDRQPLPGAARRD